MSEKYFERAHRRAFLQGAGALAAAGALAPGAVFAADARWRPSKSAVVINALGGVGNPNGEAPSEAQIAAHWLDPRGLADAQKSEMNAVNLTLGYVFGDGEPFEETIEDIAWWDAAVRAQPDQLMRVYSSADILATKKSGRVGLIYGFQNTAMLGEDAGRVDVFADLGVKIIQLTYNIRNKVGDGSLVPENRGLTDFGREVVAKLNERRVLVDLSHAGEQTTMDAIEASKAPIAITHTGCAALEPHPRNKTDTELRALADSGGVAGIYWMPYLTLGRQQMAADIVEHIDHAVNVCGEDHVGVGTDGSVSAIDDMAAYKEYLREDIENRKKLGVGAPGESADITLSVPDLMGVDQFTKLGGLLKQRGYSNARVDKIMGGNFMRQFAEVWGA